MASYAICVFAALFAGGFALVQWSLDQTPWAVGILPLAGLGALVTYAFARLGQKRSRGQMDSLRGFLDATLLAPKASGESAA